jgi:endonuclease-3 related protein
MDFFKNLYEELFDKYGPQGWWPLLDVDGTNPTKTGSIKGYHPKDYSYPRNERQRFEICIGAILTQNTSWANVEKALINLKENNLLEPKRLIGCNENMLRGLTKPSGYFNQKSERLKIFSEFYLALEGKTPTPKELLAVKGIGPETCDSILLYGYKVPTFVVDAYTKRFLIKRAVIDEEYGYYEIKELFESNMKKDLVIFQEFHALIVEEEKREKR